MSEPAKAQEPHHHHLYLIDGSGFIFRAFHALPPMTRPDGTPVNAVYGFTNMLIKLLADTESEGVAVIFDAGRKSFRNDIYPEYKAHRPEPPEELIPQFDLIREATRAFNVPCVELINYEADDLIATYVKRAREAGLEVTIVSSDKDLMQLVGEGVAMLDPMKNRAIGPEQVVERFGVPPDKVIDVQALAGDSTDNVPGVPGIGVKTAAQLIEDYGDLDTLLSRAGEIKQPKRRENLIEFAEQARVSRDLVTLKDDVPVEVPLEALKLHAPEPETLRAFLEENGFRSVIARLRALLGEGSAEAEPAQPPGAADSFRTWPRSRPGSARRRRGGSWRSTPRPPRSMRSAPTSSASRSRLLPERPAISRSAMARPRATAGSSWRVRAARPSRFPSRTRWPRSSRSWRTRAF
jgi:DNA polymerase-1